ncbi:mfs multidrug [Fusarium langsethiae]|uniref:Mfs multidrug n=1 Tax=Fusarium langsethiae TaxID=179993 RepID=A0A0N0DFF7_FUSLA|nr:mfs multidrug [Fusarium langsethiae]
MRPRSHRSIRYEAELIKFTSDNKTDGRSPSTPTINTDLLLLYRHLVADFPLYQCIPCGFLALPRRVCVSWGSTIISTEIPAITHDFRAIKDIGQRGTTLSLTNYAFLSVFRKTYTLLDIKTTFVTSVAFFGIDSALRGAGLNSIALIIVELV